MSFYVNGNMFFIDGAPICTLDFKEVTAYKSQKDYIAGRKNILRR